MIRGIDVIFQARVGTAPILHRTSSGRCYVTFRVANSEPIRKSDGTWNKRPTTWMTAKAWDGLAQNISASVAVGTPLVLTGKLRTEVWENREGIEQSTCVIALTAAGIDLAWTQCRELTAVRPATGGGEKIENSTDEPSSGTNAEDLWGGDSLALPKLNDEALQIGDNAEKLSTEYHLVD